MNNRIYPHVVENLLGRIKKDQPVGGVSREEQKHLAHMEREKLIEQSKAAKCGWKVLDKAKPSAVNEGLATPKEKSFDS
jgi:hypothetical protein